MKQKSYILLTIVAILVIIILAALVYLNYRPTDSRCNWESGLCKNICQSQNYYFDSDSKECKKYVEPSINKGCCTSPPFETLEECKSICE